MISVDGLTVEFGGSALFSDVSFVINEKDRIALMGKNGAGKSTLLKILAGVREPSRGKVSAPKDTGDRLFAAAFDDGGWPYRFRGDGAGFRPSARDGGGDRRIE